MGPYLSPGVYVEEVPSAIRSIVGVATSVAGFIGIMPESFKLPARAATGGVMQDFTVPTPQAKAVLITNWAQFGRAFGDLLAPAAAPVAASAARSDEKTTKTKSPQAAAAASLVDEPSLNTSHRNLAHAVYGFFNNGGSRCYVGYVDSADKIQDILDEFNAIDEIALVCAPGVVADAPRNKIIDSCELLGDRFAILDGPATAPTDLNNLIKPVAEVSTGLRPKRTASAAFYYPWINVFDPGVKLMTTGSDGTVAVPPSGHIAGMYARVDTERGFFKSPANEPLRGALGIAQPVSKIEQDVLNPKGVNCIRTLNGNVYVWGARTVGGDENQDSKYISVRRTMMFIKESIDEGTQWAVFEPHTPVLWQALTRNITAFLTNLWRAGALFGTTAQQAFYVRCDESLNPLDQRADGKVVTEIGVAIVRPAEFVVFQVSQFTGSN